MVSSVAIEVYGYAVELYRLGRLGKLTRVQLARARRLMGLLRESGFGAGEISVLSGKRWDASGVRRYAVWSGLKDMSRKDEVLAVFAECVAKGGRIDDVPGYLVAKEALEPQGMSFANAAVVGKAMEVSGALPSVMVAFSLELIDGRRTIVDLRARMRTDEDLNALGLTRRVQERIAALAKSHPSVHDFLDVLAGYETYDKIQIERIREEIKLDALKVEFGGLTLKKQELEGKKQELEKEIFSKEWLAVELRGLEATGWTPGTLNLFGQMLKNFGSIPDVITAIVLYPTLKAYREALDAMKRMIEGGKNLTEAKLTVGQSGEKGSLTLSKAQRDDIRKSLLQLLEGISLNPKLSEEIKKKVEQEMKEVLAGLDSREDREEENKSASSSEVNPQQSTLGKIEGSDGDDLLSRLTVCGELTHKMVADFEHEFNLDLDVAVALHKFVDSQPRFRNK